MRFPMNLPLETALGRYKIISLIGSGGMGRFTSRRTQASGAKSLSTERFFPDACV
jgi:hypothetical protein